MVIHYTYHLEEALTRIDYQGETVVMPLHDPNMTPEEAMLEHYGKTKWSVVDLLNDYYQQKKNFTFDLYNWLYHNTADEVAYFLNEVGSNCLNYADGHWPCSFQVWLGKSGFILAITQMGRGFNAPEIDARRLKENEGGAFEFFRHCKNTIFFNNPTHATTVYMEYLFQQ